MFEHLALICHGVVLFGTAVEHSGSGVMLEGAGFEVQCSVSTSCSFSATGLLMLEQASTLFLLLSV